ncbi:MAG: hypothetical protein QOD99_2362 [Chthoniobacter sp.]|nr:hypothetical protein [Chthoniobacter sp.]
MALVTPVLMVKFVALVNTLTLALAPSAPLVPAIKVPPLTVVEPL